MKAQRPAILICLLRLVLIACIGLGLPVCDFFDGGPGDSNSSVDVCEDAFNRFVTQHPDGGGVTSEHCVASETGPVDRGTMLLPRGERVMPSAGP